MNAPLSRYLTRFASEADTAVVVLDMAAAEPMITLGVAELEARLDEARASIRNAADAALARERATLLEERETAIAEALAAARAEWCAAAGERIATLVEGAFVTLHETLAAAIAGALVPLLADALRERTLATLGDAIDRLLADPMHPVITLRGPADLLDAIRANGARAGLELVAADTHEATLTGAGARIETKLTAALAALSATEI